MNHCSHNTASTADHAIGCIGKLKVDLKLDGAARQALQEKVATMVATMKKSPTNTLFRNEVKNAEDPTDGTKVPTKQEQLNYMAKKLRKEQLMKHTGVDVDHVAEIDAIRSHPYCIGVDHDADGGDIIGLCNKQCALNAFVMMEFAAVNIE
jgi:hypothetical protein